MNTQKVAAERAAALAEDATVFDYDGVYDAMQVAPAPCISVVVLHVAYTGGHSTISGTAAHFRRAHPCC